MKILYVIFSILFTSFLPFFRRPFNLIKLNDYIFITSFFAFSISIFMKMNEKKMFQYLKYTFYSLNRFLISFSKKEEYVRSIENSDCKEKKIDDFMLCDIKKSSFTNIILIVSIIFIIITSFIAFNF